MNRLLVIGIGTGNPDHLTLQAVKALAQVDVVFSFDKGEEKAALVQLRREICERFIAPRPYRHIEIVDAPRDPGVVSYAARVEAWHEQRVLACEAAMLRELGEGRTGAILVWGDPSLYDSTLRLVRRVGERGRLQFELEVIAGISR
jgi:precorrin-6A synthase